MGIPKFFRWCCERYPLCLQVISSDAIPEFDNLYLDMNGIIHACSHPNDNNTFKITNEQIYLNIFNYLDFIFAKIKPKQLLFMAVDGVAPRAKMNQQRSRRFRSAKDRKDAVEKAKKNGEKLELREVFDSNCITPGTTFMVELSAQLKYFIHKKVSSDANWRGIKIILSGHEVPGEGEHKIMEYIRHAKSQPDYTSKRHCLYGLDADLIMLGLLSHEENFSLLREEVKFGCSNKKKGVQTPENANFNLFHLSLLREYLDMEFHDIKATLPFEYDLERIIDDFILLGFFIGNDFLPHLPKLHINEGAISLIFRAYKKILVEAGGYLHDAGNLNHERLKLLVVELKDFEREVWLQERGDMGWAKSKRTERNNMEKSRRKRQERNGGNPGSVFDEVENGDEDDEIGNVISSSQSGILEQIANFMDSDEERLVFDSLLPARDRAFITKVASRLNYATGTTTDRNEKSMFIEINSDEDDDEEGYIARQRVLSQLQSIPVSDEPIPEVDHSAEFEEWKQNYYNEKLNMKTEADIKVIVKEYITGLSWVLKYYFEGVQDWGWFFPFHYTPKISDLSDHWQLPNPLELGTPFKPFEQLMGVLPSASMNMIPEAYRDLMVDSESPIIDFYPLEFELDMNEKKADWEALVKIPFIDQKRLVEALQSREKRLTDEERQRNSFGNAYEFTYTPEISVYPSSLPGKFPQISNNQCRMCVWSLPPVPETGFRKGRVTHGHFAGFPTMKTIPCTSVLGYHGVNVFQTESKNESMVITIQSPFESPNSYEKIEGTEIPNLLGKRVYVNWPNHYEAIVAQILDSEFVYRVDADKYYSPPWVNRPTPRTQIVKEPHDHNSLRKYENASERMEQTMGKRFGVVIGEVEVVLICAVIDGMKVLDDGAIVKRFGGTQETALQLIIESLPFEDKRYNEIPPPPLLDEFPISSYVFMTGAAHIYGSMMQVVGGEKNQLRLKHADNEPDERELAVLISNLIKEFERSEKYEPSYNVAKRLRISPLNLSKITSSLHIQSSTSDQKINLGLNLKFDAKGKKVLGYSRKFPEGGWEFSQRTIDLLVQYKEAFPELFQAVEQKTKDYLLDSDIFGNADCAKKINEVKEWLKNAGVKDTDRVSLETRALTKEYISKMENAIQTYHEYRNLVKSEPNYVIVANVPRQAVVKPAHAFHRLANQVFDLGDRVMHIPDSGSVPMGARGTIVGLDEGNIMDVVFDDPFLGGYNLEGRCSELKGMSLDKRSLLNLSKQQLLPGYRPSTPQRSQQGQPIYNRQNNNSPRPQYSRDMQNNSPRAGSPSNSRQGNYGNSQYNNEPRSNSYQNQQRSTYNSPARPNQDRDFRPRVEMRPQRPQTSTPQNVRPYQQGNQWQSHGQGPTQQQLRPQQNFQSRTSPLPANIDPSVAVPANPQNPTPPLMSREEQISNELRSLLKVNSPQTEVEKAPILKPNNQPPTASSVSPNGWNAQATGWAEPQNQATGWNTPNLTPAGWNSPVNPVASSQWNAPTIPSASLNPVNNPAQQASNEIMALLGVKGTSTPPSAIPAETPQKPTADLEEVRVQMMSMLNIGKASDPTSGMQSGNYGTQEQQDPQVQRPQSQNRPPYPNQGHNSYSNPGNRNSYSSNQYQSGYHQSNSQRGRGRGSQRGRGRGGYSEGRGGYSESRGGYQQQ